jgi:hypothetical protein
MCKPGDLKIDNNWMVDGHSHSAPIKYCCDSKKELLDLYKSYKAMSNSNKRAFDIVDTCMGTVLFTHSKGSVCFDSVKIRIIKPNI